MICVDASLAAKWIFRESHYQEARALYRACVQARQRMVGPPLLPIEVANILRQRTRRRPPLSLPDAAQLLRRFLAFPIELVAPTGLYELALSLAHAHNLAAVYDAHYVALSQLLGCNLWTADERLVSAVASRLPFVKSVRGYVAGRAL